MVTFDEWFISKQGEAYDSMYCFARDAWEAAQDVDREACLVEIEQGIWFDKTTSEILDSIAEAIRARGEK